MDGEWEQVKEIFGEALELESEARAAYLERACANQPALRAEVERLLLEDADPDAPMSESSIWKLADFAPAREPRRQTAIGGFHLRRLWLFAAIALLALAGMYLLFSSRSARWLGGSGLDVRRLTIGRFAPQGRDSDLAALALGLTESIGIRIEEFEEASADLTVTRLFRAVDQRQDFAAPPAFEPDRELVLAGTLEAAGRDLRLTLRLSTLSGRSRKIVLNEANVIRLEDRAVESVSEALGLANLRSATESNAAPSAAAYRAYLTAEGYLRTPLELDGLLRSTELFRKSLSLSANPEKAYRGLCEAMLRRHEIESSTELLGLARSYCERAASLDPSDERTRSLLAEIEAESLEAK